MVGEKRRRKRKRRRERGGGERGGDRDRDKGWIRTHSPGSKTTSAPFSSKQPKKKPRLRCRDGCVVALG